MIRWGCALTAMVLAASFPTGARQAPVSFRVERPITTGAPGPHRLPVDVPLLSRARPFDRVRPVAPDGLRALDGLADLRLFDGAGREVPYIQMYAGTGEPQWARASILPVAETKRTSGFEADLGSARAVDALELHGLQAPFLKRLVLEGSGDRQRWTMLVPQGTLFDLPAERLRRTTIAFPAGSYRYLRVTWDDTNSGRVPTPARVRARVVRADTAPHLTPAAPVTIETRPSEPGRSRYRLRLPAAQLPIVAVVLDVDGGHVLREARVLESQVSGPHAIPVELGRATLRRVEKDGLAAEALRVTIARPREAEVELIVDDGSNPPLNLRGAAVEFAELPWLYFEAPGGTMTARYGESTASAPSYDLEAARESVRLGDIPEARWGDPRDSTELESAGVPPLPDAGAGIDVETFRYRRPIPDGPAGLVALGLDAAVLARSRGPEGSFADVRIVDESGRQVPYLLERRDEPLSLDLTLRAGTLKNPDAAQANRSVHTVSLPYPDLPSPRLVLETGERLFQRRVQVGIERPPDRAHRDVWFDELASALWQHADRQRPAPALVVPISPGEARDLLIVVDEGDNQPLPIGAVRLLLPSWRLRFYRPERDLRLLYGREDLQRPRYDLSLLAPQVMGAAASAVVLPAEDASSGAGMSPLVSPAFFWGGLTVAALILLAVIARLVKGGL
jgi:hypothetical protein